MNIIFEFKRIIKYVFYIFFARHKKGHGIHSPFVYKLINQVFNHPNNSEIFQKIESTRKQSLKNKQKITLNSLGSKSKILQNHVKLKQLVKYVTIPKKYGKLLFNLVEYLKPTTIIELGTSVGISTLYLAYAARNNKVYSIEGDKNLTGIAMKNIETHNLKNVSIIKAVFQDILPKILENSTSKLFIFIDGDHRAEPMLNYLNEIYKYVNNNTILVIDDIYLNKEMMRVWKIMKNDKRVKVTIDVFRMGIIFFNTALQKQNFTIKY